MRAAVTHLIEHGHTRIAFVGHHAISESQQRYEAYAATLAGRGLGLDPQLVVSFEREAQVSRTGDLASMGRLAGRQLLERQASEPRGQAVAGEYAGAPPLRGGLAEASPSDGSVT
jgi:hypothetical protein